MEACLKLWSTLRLECVFTVIRLLKGETEMYNNLLSPEVFYELIEEETQITHEITFFKPVNNALDSNLRLSMYDTTWVS